MPRHRVKSRPQHRAKRQEIWPGRGVQPAAASEPAGKCAVPRAPVVRRLTIQPEYGRALRGVMLTPWFAVSVGIVIAASLTLASPHAALSFPPRQDGKCEARDCRPGGTGPQPAVDPGIRLPVSARHYVSARVSGIGVEYQLLPRRRDGFIAVIKIEDQRPLGKWSLRFVLPGARIGSIIWANWEPQGSAGVVVQGAPLPWPRSSADETRIVIFGTGTPGWPTDCVIDGASCSFSLLGGASGQPGR